MRATGRLAFPVVAAHVGTMAMGVVDIAMIGRVSPVDLAAAAIGHVYSFGMLLFGMGTLQALDPVISQAIGAKDHRSIGTNLQRAAVLASLVSLPVVLLSIPAEAIFAFLGQKEEVIPTATGYVHASIPGVVPFLVFVLLRQTLQAFSSLRAIVLTIVLANVANAGLNWVLIFGHYGFPAMGAVGCSWGTAVCRWLMAGLLLAFGWRELRPHIFPLRREALELEPLLRLLQLGAPIGAAFCLEYGAFMTTCLFMGNIGTHEVAGHQVAVNLASLSFMFPLGIGAAAAVRVGYAVGRADPAGARRAAAVSMLIGTALMVLFAIAFLGWPRPLALAYTNQAEVVAMAVLLLPLAGLFQVFDGVQVVATGVLRGLGDTRTPMLVHLFGFWIVGVPLGYWLAFHTEVGSQGPWWGLVVGLAVAAVFLLYRADKRLRQKIERVVIDAQG